MGHEDPLDTIACEQFSRIILTGLCSLAFMFAFMYFAASTYLARAREACTHSSTADLPFGIWGGEGGWEVE